MELSTFPGLVTEHYSPGEPAACQATGGPGQGYQSNWGCGPLTMVLQSTYTDLRLSYPPRVPVITWAACGHLQFE